MIFGATRYLRKQEQQSKDFYYRVKDKNIVKVMASEFWDELQRNWLHFCNPTEHSKNVSFCIVVYPGGVILKEDTVVSFAKHGMASLESHAQCTGLLRALRDEILLKCKQNPNIQKITVSKTERAVGGNPVIDFSFEITNPNYHATLW